MADPPETAQLTWTPIGAVDVPRWHVLAEAVRQADDGDEYLTAEDLADYLDSSAERWGLKPIRWFSVLQRDLDEPMPEAPELASGLRLIGFRAELDEAVRSAHNEAFGDHWNFQPWTRETWQQWETGHRDFRPDWSFLVLDGEEVAGYALSAGFEAEWAVRGRREGWTNKLGVRRPWRGRGLAKALLVATMNAFGESGMQCAGLDVDAANPTGAVQLYTGLGYALRRRQVCWALEL